MINVGQIIVCVCLENGVVIMLILNVIFVIVNMVNLVVNGLVGR